MREIDAAIRPYIVSALMPFFERLVVRPVPTRATFAIWSRNRRAASERAHHHLSTARASRRLRPRRSDTRVEKKRRSPWAPSTTSGPGVKRSHTRPASGHGIGPLSIVSGHPDRDRTPANACLVRSREHAARVATPPPTPRTANAQSARWRERAARSGARDRIVVDVVPRARPAVYTASTARCASTPAFANGDSSRASPTPSCEASHALQPPRARPPRNPCAPSSSSSHTATRSTLTTSGLADRAHDVLSCRRSAPRSRSVGAARSSGDDLGLRDVALRDEMPGDLSHPGRSRRVTSIRTGAGRLLHDPLAVDSRSRSTRSSRREQSRVCA